MRLGTALMYAGDPRATADQVAGRESAELADGWHPFLFVPEKAAGIWGDALAVGAARRSADLGPLDVVAGGPLAIGDDVTGLRELARLHIALYVGGMGARPHLLPRRG